MKKNIKTSILLIVSLFCILCLTSCVFGDRGVTTTGTKPTIIDVFYTDNTAPDNYSDWSQLPDRSNYMAHGTDYCLVCKFSDPDMDANKLYLSTSSSFPTGSTWTFDINQTYTDQASWWRDYWTGSSTGYTNFYLYVEDEAGNESDKYTLTVYFIE